MDDEKLLDVYSNLAQITVSDADCYVLLKKVTPSGLEGEEQKVEDLLSVRFSLPVAKKVATIMLELLEAKEKDDSNESVGVN